MSLLYEILESWHNTEGTVSTMGEILEWIDHRTRTLTVQIDKTVFPEESFGFGGGAPEAGERGFWFYDERDGYIRNRNNSFFQLAGYQELEGGRVVLEQPVILQLEIGYLGILCRRMNGVLNFLMQAKIEPGNVNSIQISPTIQATKSNFTRKHGGAEPAYLSYFRRAQEYTVLVDQVQSEQSSRFYRKRNRNIMLYVEEDLEVLPSHKWMTLGQIKELMKYDNLVNMDTRTVLSGISYSRDLLERGEAEKAEALFRDKALFRSMFGPAPGAKSGDGGTAGSCDALLHRLFDRINDYKMFTETEHRLVPLRALDSWVCTPREIVCRTPYDFKIIYCEIEIEGREVRRWEQPLVEACGMLLLALYTRVRDGERQFLVRIRHEIGCFDTVELSPSVQLEPTNPARDRDTVEQHCIGQLERGEGILRDVILSEEGGRFYHEQNRNVILEAGDAEILQEDNLPEDYCWTDYRTLNRMVQFNNYLNIQLRNLLSILEL